MTGFMIDACTHCGQRLDSDPARDCPDPDAHRTGRKSTRHPDTLCTNLAHMDGEHDASCMPPADPDDPAMRLLRAIFGLCSLCDRTEEHEHSDEEILAHGMVPYREEP